MPGVLTNVVKGSMLRNVDNRLHKRSGETNVDYQDRLKELKRRFELGQAGMSLLDHARVPVNANDRKVAENQAQEDHVAVEFFGNNAAKRFFPGMAVDTEDEIVRAAYIKAIELALGTTPPKPIVSYWIINGRRDTDPDCFEVFVSDSELEIHVLLLTPLPVHVPPPTQPGRSQNMFVVSTNQRIDDIGNSWPPIGYPKKETTMPGTVGVKCLEVMGY